MWGAATDGSKPRQAHPEYPEEKRERFLSAAEFAAGSAK